LATKIRWPVAVVTLLIAVLIHPASSQGLSAQGCYYGISGSNGTYLSTFNGACPNGIAYTFATNSTNNRLSCYSNSSKIVGVEFMNGSYNNSMVNCTYSGAQILSLHGAQNNLISPYGTYSTNFTDNSSNIAIGYYLRFVTRDENGAITPAGYITIAPYNMSRLIRQASYWFGGSQSSLVATAISTGFRLPRFGYYPSSSSPGVYSEALEAEQISKSGVYSYNPYWLVCTYWGHDDLTFKTFDIGSNTNYTPMLLYPTTKEYVYYPDNATIYWNFSVVKYNNASNVTAYLMNSWQFDAQNNTIEYEQHNVTSGSISYRAGIETPGTHEYIGMLYSPEAKEMDNSTTETYSVGLSYCLLNGIINRSGYYSMVYNNLTDLRIFWRGTQLCLLPIYISHASNVTIDCKGGTVNSTITDISVIKSKGIDVENCRLLGNALHLLNSTNVTIENTTMTATNNSSYVMNISLTSNIFLVNDNLSGYANYSLGQVNMIKTIYGNMTGPVNITVSTTIPSTAAAQTQQQAAAQQGGASAAQVILLYIEFSIAFFLLGLVIFIVLHSQLK